MQELKKILDRLREEAMIDYLYLALSTLLFLTVLILSFKIQSPLKNILEESLSYLFYGGLEGSFMESISLMMKFLKLLVWLSLLFALVDFFTEKTNRHAVYRYSFMISSLLAVFAITAMRPLYKALPSAFSSSSETGLFGTVLANVTYLERSDFFLIAYAYRFLILAAGFAFISMLFTALKVFADRNDRIEWLDLRKGELK